MSDSKFVVSMVVLVGGLLVWLGIASHKPDPKPLKSNDLEPVVVEEVYEPNYAVVPLPTKQNPMFVVAAKSGENWRKALEEAFGKLPGNWTRFPLPAIRGGGKELDESIDEACRKLKDKGYDSDRAYFVSYFKR